MENSEKGITHRVGTFTSENANAMQLRSAAKRKANRIMRDVLEEELWQEIQVVNKDGEVFPRAKLVSGMRKLADRVASGDQSAIYLAAKIMGVFVNRVDMTTNGKDFEVKVVKVSEDMQDKINGYLNGGGLDG